ncbi:MAG TPA: cytochrome c [Acetobacteraceae bacterium]
MQRCFRVVPFLAVALAATATSVGAKLWSAAAQTNAPSPSSELAPPQPPDKLAAPVPFMSPTHSMGKRAQEENSLDQYSAAQADRLLKVPVSGLHPGGVKISPDMPNPVANDPDAANRGMRYFINLNCVGCHAPNGGGGMGPSLSDRVFIYGDKPEQIYLSILQGRPHGMPAWGGSLPDSVVWDLVAYIENISRAPDQGWGRTVSPTSPKIEQVPAEYQLSTRPWEHTQPFGYGQNPEGQKQ